MSSIHNQVRTLTCAGILQLIALVNIVRLLHQHLDRVALFVSEIVDLHHTTLLGVFAPQAVEFLLIVHHL